MQLSSRPWEGKNACSDPKKQRAVGARDIVAGADVFFASVALLLARSRALRTMFHIVRFCQKRA
jgi:hypothetical protein